MLFVAIAALIVLYRRYKIEVGRRPFQGLAELKALFGGKPIPPVWKARIDALEAEIAALKSADEAKARKIAGLESAMRSYGFL
jgi:hypothetical protein